MRIHTLFLLFELLVVCCVAESIVSRNRNRRILHQPLFPSSSSPPPVVPPPPPDSPDQPFFPEVPNGQSQTPPASTNGPDPITGTTHAKNPTKKLAIVVVSVGIVTLGLLCALSLYLYRHKRRRKHPVTVQARKSDGTYSAAAAPDPSSFLYLGTVDTHSAAAAQKSDRYRPSPELQPLPPLRGSGRPPTNSTALYSSDEGSSSPDLGFYTPHGSLAGTDDGVSTPVSRQSSRNSKTKRASSSSRSHVIKHAIIPSIKAVPPPPPPPLHHILPSRPKFGAPPPPPNLALLQSISNQSHLPPPQQPDSAAVPKLPTTWTNFIPESDDSERSKPRLKPLHWDKVKATSDRATVWDQLQPTSFELNEDRMETLFGSNSGNNEASRKSVLPATEQQQYKILNPKKSQNIAIQLRALNVTRDEVSQALLQGNPEALGADLLETLAKMAPTKEEDIKLKGYKGDNSKLSSAERFLKAILDVPFAFRRVDAMQYRATFDAEVNYLRKSFSTLEEASRELRNSRLFLKLLEAVLTTGNRMNIGTNRGGAQSFKLDTLLKLVDIKGVDRKTTLLHFVVQEMTKSEGTGSVSQTASSKAKEEEFRRQGLQVVSGLSREIPNVKLAAGMDSDVLHNYVSKLETGAEQVRATLVLHEELGIVDGFYESMKAFVERAKEDICRIKEDERRALTVVKEVTEYIHGDAAKEESHPLRIFVIVRDFLLTLDGVCKDVRSMQERPVMGAARSFHISSNARLAVHNRYKITRDDSSNEESSSP